MKQESMMFASSNGRDSIQGYYYFPEGDPKGMIQISHGMCEYIQRYLPWIDFMTKQGFAVCGNDHLGHGNRAKVNNQLGYFSEKDGRIFLVEDLHTMTMLAKQKCPKVPYILLGHSMGSFVARQYTAQYGEELNAVIFMGTSGKNPLDWAGIGLTSMLAAFRGKKKTSKLVDKLAFGAYNKRIENPLSKDAWLSRDEDIVQAYGKDPLCQFSFTLGAYKELFSLLKGVSNERWAGKVPKELPILLISGQEDPVGQYGKGVQQVSHWLTQTGHTKVDLKLYPGARHEVLNESNRHEVYTDMMNWILRWC